MAIETNIFKDGSYWVWITLSGSEMDHYGNLGYEIIKRRDMQGRLATPRGTTLLVRVEHLPEHSTAKITKICDNADCDVDGGKRILNQTYDNILRKRANSNGLDLCKKCGSQRGAKNRIDNIKYEDCLYNTDYEFIKCLKDQVRGYKLTFGSSRREDFICPICKFEIKNKVVGGMIVYFRNNKSLPCPRCSDGISYPEKFATCMFAQTSYVYETQKSFNWSKNYRHVNPKLCGDKRYDGYLSQFQRTVELHGKQHYAIGFKGNMTLEEITENDKIKESLAKENENPCIIIDCRKSEMEYIKNSILKSELSNLIDVSNIDWLECHKNGCSSLVKISCDLWNIGLKSTKLISEKIKISEVTIRKYLNQGVKLNWCDYDPKKESVKFYGKGAQFLKKRIFRLNLLGEYLDEFESISEASRKFNIQIGGISLVCNGKQKKAGGFKWMFKEDYEKYIGK